MRSWSAVWVNLLTCLLCIGGGIYALTQDQDRAVTVLWLCAPLCLFGALISVPKNGGRV